MIHLAARLLTVCLAGLTAHAAAFDTPMDLATLYQSQVDRTLALPESEQHFYADLLRDALIRAGIDSLSPQYFVLVDRDPDVQAVMIYWGSLAREFVLIGASPCATGRPGEYEHFRTPTGVFDHTVANLDFRAEGTRNAQGIRGYGKKGMRVYDFGWVKTERGWGAHAESFMRLQMHSTDPELLEPRLGLRHSKGCIRIPASLNVFIDRYGILDADYERLLSQGKRLWLLRADRQPTAWSGRYLVVVDSQRQQRPDWSPKPH